MGVRIVLLRVVVGLAVAAGITAASVSGGTGDREQPLTAAELRGAVGTCCSDDFIDSLACAVSNGRPCLSCLVAPATCGTSREYSGHAIQQCRPGSGGTCTTVARVDCWRDTVCSQYEPWLRSCPGTGGSCTYSTTTDCVLCTQGGAPGPWVQVDSQICQ